MMTDDLLRIAHRQVYASFFSTELQSRVNRVFKEREPLIVPMPGGESALSGRPKTQPPP